MTWLIDTSIVSELARPRPDAGVECWAASVGEVALSVITVDELAFGLAWRPNARIQRWLEEFLPSCRILPVDEETARRAGELRGGLAARGITRSQPDMLIAATARHNRLTLVTRNLRDFDGCGIALLNPFSA
ncbi:MAG: type II toxin-antitoxin system VapC family toxin [Betaproteobacteria bacterium]|nr:type II toxin-antitoxin system VapC family toxin [Betaproteobacteria bacterium]